MAGGLLSHTHAMGPPHVAACRVATYSSSGMPVTVVKMKTESSSASTP